jgi:hypothetical protein
VHKEKGVEMSVRQKIDIFRLQKKTKGLHLTLFSSGQSVWPLPTIHSFLSFLSLSPFISFTVFFPSGEKNDDNTQQRQVKYHRKKISQGL